MHCWIYFISYRHTSIPVEGYSKTSSHVSTQVQGDIYTHMIWTTVYKSVYLYTSVLNYETVRHTSDLVVYGTHTYLVLRSFLFKLDFRMVIGYSRFCPCLTNESWTLVNTVMNVQVPLNAGNSWLAEQLLVSQVRLSSMKFMKLVLEWNIQWGSNICSS